MASTYSTSLRIELMADGENSNSWGDKTNTNWGLLEQAVSGVASVAMTDADYTLTTSNAATDEARNAVITMTGTLTQARNVIVPSVDKQYVVKNSTTGGFGIVVKTSGGTGVTIPNGGIAQVYCDATNVVLAETGGATTAILVGGGVGSLPIWTAATGSGAPVRATSPTLVTPNIGVATATSVNGLISSRGTGNVASNVAIGPSALSSNTTGAGNIAIGDAAGYGITTGGGNVAIGNNAGNGSPTNASDNVLLGRLAGSSSGSSISGSVAIGGASQYNIGGQYNVSIGQNTLSDAFSDGTTVGTCTAIGALAFTADGGGVYANTMCLGYNAQPSANTVSNEITLGNSSIATLRCQVTSITALSDARDKTDVVPLPSGIDTIMALNPVRFTWNMRDGGKVGIKDAGFIAQDLQTVDDEYLQLVYAENPEKLEASYGRLIPVLVKAIQELQQQINELKVGK